jgi:hypothetical protein
LTIGQFSPRIVGAGTDVLNFVAQASACADHPGNPTGTSPAAPPFSRNIVLKHGGLSPVSRNIERDDAISYFPKPGLAGNDVVAIRRAIGPR